VKLKINLVREQTKILKPDIAIASLVSSLKNDIKSGTTAPPPPIPPIVQSIIKKEMVIRPAISRPSTGNMPL
jgi:hypothetical protein